MSAVDLPATTPLAPVAGRSQAASGRLRVLVIDDEPGVRRYVRRALDLAGHLVVEAPDGRTGIDQVVAGAPDVVLLDLGLSDLPGEEVLRRIRALRPRLPVLVWTAAADVHAERRCRSLGSDTFLHKPVALAALIASVDEVGER